MPPDNPFVSTPGAKPEIWSYGHRNSQGAALHPQTGKLWTHEHGPRGGDEINIPQAGKNYGWPVIGYGIDYGGAKIHESTHKDGMEQPVKYWVPSIAPSGMAFYTGDLFPGLARQPVRRRAGEPDAGRGSKLDGEKVVKEERLLQGLERAHPRRPAGPDGALWLRHRRGGRPHPARRPGEVEIVAGRHSASDARFLAVRHTADKKRRYPPPPIQ